MAGQWTTVLRMAPDTYVRRPLWEVPPAARKAVLHERRRRFGILDEYIDPDSISDEPAGDPDYT